MTGHFEEKNEIKNLIYMKQMKIKKFKKNIMKFGKVLKKTLKRLMVVKKLNMGKTLKKQV